MAGAAKVNINVTDLTQSVVSPTEGIAFLQGQSLRGPFASPDEVITSWSRFVAIYGGLSLTTDAPLLAKRLLEKGGSIRFNRIGHYTDNSNASTLTAIKAQQPEVTMYEFDDALVSSNQITFEVEDGESHIINFTLNNNNTLKKIAEALETEDTVGSAVVIPAGPGDSNRVIFVTPAPGKTFALDTAMSVTGGATQANVTEETFTEITNSDGDELFQLVPKYPGADYNNFQITVTPASNGAPEYFDILIEHIKEPEISEKYTNLTIPSNTDIGNSNYLEKVVVSSQYFDVVYKDLTSLEGQQVPLPISFRMDSGSDGDAVTTADYIGDSSARTGLYAFDPYDDSYYLASLDHTSTDVDIAASAYAANRKDVIYMLEFNPNLKTKSAILNSLQTMNIDTQYTYMFGGGVKILNPQNSQQKESRAIADVLAVAINSDKNYGPWYSFAGPNRGNITGVLGVITNFGAPASYADLDDLANRRINMIINRSNSIKLWGNFSAQKKETQQRFISIVKLLIYLKKSLRPTLEEYLEEPNDIPTWNRIFYTVKPFMDSLVTRRALYTYDWQGDQYAGSMKDLQINNTSDVSDGKYKVILQIQAIPSIQEINLAIVMTKAGVDFNVVMQQI